jgi:outer membrane protein insertion porin family
MTFSVTRDTRDEPFDASSGWLTSHTFEYAAPALGSDLSLFRYFGQFFRYFPLSRPAEVPFSGGLGKPRFVFATGARVGLVGGLGDAVAPDQRFFAGGGTTIRGFREDSVGPMEADVPAGGDLVFVLNNEIRFPLFSILEGVGFADRGNVYSGVGEFGLFDMRTSAGFGLRVRTPYFLLRADYGFNLNRREGEQRGAFFFSIGQAF